MNDILEAFGEFVGGNLVTMYWHMVDPEWKTLDLIEYAEKSIHVNIRKTVMGALPPHLKCIRISPKEVHVIYGSQRRMCAVAKGMIKGIAAYYEEKVTVQETQCMHTGHPWCELVVKLGREEFMLNDEKNSFQQTLIKEAPVMNSQTYVNMPHTSKVIPSPSNIQQGINISEVTKAFPVATPSRNQNSNAQKIDNKGFDNLGSTQNLNAPYQNYTPKEHISKIIKIQITHNQ